MLYPLLSSLHISYLLCSLLLPSSLLSSLLLSPSLILSPSPSLCAVLWCVPPPAGQSLFACLFVGADRLLPLPLFS